VSSGLRLGAVFPTSDIRDDPVAIRDFAQGVEELGLDHLVAYDHVLGAEHADRDPPLTGPYTEHDAFHEPFVLFGFLAAVTQRLELATGIVILPQRQTALAAKQAAAVDVLSGGRLRLGVGIGWNFVEFEGLNENFRNRGRRVEEQVALMRRLWTEALVDFEGKYHTVKQAGINPLPVQRPIPLWMGGGAERALRRMARIADGWMPQFRPGDQGAATLEQLRGWIHDEGRDPKDFGIEGRLSMFNTPESDWAQAIQWWRDQGATHLTFNTMGVHHATSKEHLDAVRRFKDIASA
jgi:probable F420-dependent oxidoreductase